MSVSSRSGSRPYHRFPAPDAGTQTRIYTYIQEQAEAGCTKLTQVNMYHAADELRESEWFRNHVRKLRAWTHGQAGCIALSKIGRVYERTTSPYSPLQGTPRTLISSPARRGCTQTGFQTGKTELELNVTKTRGRDVECAPRGLGMDGWVARAGMARHARGVGLRCSRVQRWGTWKVVDVNEQYGVDDRVPSHRTEGGRGVMDSTPHGDAVP